MLPVLAPWTLYPRPIPFLPEVSKRFKGAVKASDPSMLSTWTAMLQNQQAITLSSNSTAWVEVEAQTLTTGFLELTTRRGTNAEIRLLSSECYEKDLGVDFSAFPMKRSKGNRRDYTTGKLYGMEDKYVVGGGLDRDVAYEPFWFRTFRFIRLSFRTSVHPLTITGFTYRETNYPLVITTEVKLPNEELSRMWEVSLNTAKNCMHETYEDCPFYEQNQFSMDTRIQALFTYQLSRDDRLARKAIDEFHASRGRRADGLLETHFPCPFRAVHIPQFSLFWVLMVYDHMQYFGDEALVRRYLSTVDGVLNYFDTRINELGLVGQFDVEAWPFVDWVQEWHGSGGLETWAIPPAYRVHGAATYNSLLYAFVLTSAAELFDYVGRKDTAHEYRERARALTDAVNKHCFDGRFYTDGPGSSDLSQHTQVFAILSGAISGDAGKSLFLSTLDEVAAGRMPKCSYAMGFYVFRAADVAGVYTKCFDRLLEPWRGMLAEQLSTWAEDNVMFRSDCHGWSSSPIYEIVAKLFGVGLASQGNDGLVRISPNLDLLPVAAGTFQTSKGTLRLQWENRKALTVRAMGDMSLEVEWNEKKQLVDLRAGESLVVN